MEVFLKGVYFLYDGEQIVYVGKSNDIYRRIYEHSSGRSKGERKKFDSWEYLQIPDDEARSRFEAICIRAFKPKYNTDYPQITFPVPKRRDEPENIAALLDYMRSTSTDDLDIAICVPRGTFSSLIRDGTIDKKFCVEPHGLFRYPNRIDNEFIIENYEKLCELKRRMRNE